MGPALGQSSEAERQWRLQVNRLQELIDQLECKVSCGVTGAPGVDFPGICPRQAPAGCLTHTPCPSQAPLLEPLHEEDLTKGPSSVSLGKG